MDSLTHLLAAGTLAQAGLRDHRLWPGVGLLMVASLAPDLEGIVAPLDPSLYLHLYHGPMHSLVTACALAVILGLIYRRLFPGPRLLVPLLLAASGLFSHLLLDLFQGYGEQLLWPFWDRRFGWPLQAQYDLPILAFLGLALMVPALLNAVNREIGAAPVSPAPAARVGLMLVAALWPVRVIFRGKAETAARAVVTEQHESVGVFPSALLPWRWNVVEDTPISYMLHEADGWSGQMLPFLVRLRKPIPNNLLITARDTLTAHAFLELARYPYYSLEEGDRGVRVRIRDLAYFHPGGSDRPHSVEIEVTSTGRVLSERVVF